MTPVGRDRGSSNRVADRGQLLRMCSFLHVLCASCCSWRASEQKKRASEDCCANLIIEESRLLAREEEEHGARGKSCPPRSFGVNIEQQPVGLSISHFDSSHGPAGRPGGGAARPRQRMGEAS